MIGAILFLIIIIALIAKNVRIVPQQYVFIIERLGKYKTTWSAGLHVKMPFIDNVVEKISLKEQVLDFQPQRVITKDNVTIQIDSVVFVKVFDPKLYTYGIEDAITGLSNLSATSLRNVIGELELDETLTSRDTINNKLETILDEATDAWGLKITRFEIKNIDPPHEIEEVMTKQMRAERERRQTVLEAKAHQEAVVARAEGDKRAKILAAQADKEANIALAEGQAKSIELVYEAEADGIRKLNAASPTGDVLKLKGIQALKDVADGQATKIYMPTDIADFVTTLGVTGEALGIGDKTPIKPYQKPKQSTPKDPCIKPQTSREGKIASRTSSQINQEVQKNNRHILDL